MSLSLAYANTPSKNVYDTIVIAHFDSHGVATAAARARALMLRGERVAIFIRYPATGPTPQFPQFVDELRSQVEAKVAEVIDIPVNVRSPDIHIDAEARLPATSAIFHYDHHETSVAFAQRLAARGITPVMTANAVQMAAALGLLAGEDAKQLAVIGIVADRDPSVLSIVSREEVERRYLPLANKLDVIVRQPSIMGCNDQGCVAERLAENPAWLEALSVEYPPYSEVDKAHIMEVGDIAVLADFESVAPQWAPKTAEELLRRRGRHYAVFIAPAIDPRTRQQTGWDVRVLQYWLSEAKPTPEEVVRDIATRMAPGGNVVGHEKYISLRLTSATKEQAIQLARQIFQRLEGTQPSAAHLVSDSMVAAAVRRDYQQILQRLTEILSEMRNMYREYLRLKEKQVELLERTTEERTRTLYD